MAAQPVNVYTDEKAKRLVRTFGASLAFAVLLCWFEIVILRPAGEMEKEMVGFWCRLVFDVATMWTNGKKIPPTETMVTNYFLQSTPTQLIY